MELEIFIKVCGLLAIPGAIIYAVGDVLLLAGKARIDDYPKLAAHAKLLSGSEKMVALSPSRLLWGGLLGVFATPLILAGFLQVFAGLYSSSLTAALPPAVLFGYATMVGAFVHGSFIYLGQYVQALNKVDTGSQPVILEMFGLHRKIMVVTYSLLLFCIIAASLWFSVVVWMGGTAYPVWMAAVNPLTMFIVWLVVKKVMPKIIVENTEGAGFNIAYLLFFIFSTITLWNG